MIEEFQSKKFLLKQLVKRDLTSKYKDSTLGVIWSFLNPLLLMLVFTGIFSVLFRFKIHNYPVYFLAGRIVFSFYNDGTKGAMSSIKRNSSILKKIYVPRYMFAVGTISYEFVNFLISFIILFGVMIITGVNFHFSIIYSIIPIVFLLLFVFGLGLILTILNTYFSDIGYLYNVFTLIMMYASALFYPMEIVPANIQMIFTLNPVYSAISCFRDCVIYGVFPDIPTLFYLGVFSMVVFGIGVLLFRIYENKLTLEL